MSDGRRIPVLLVPGWSDRAPFLRPLRARFLASGWQSPEVVIHDFEDPVDSNITHGEELVRAIHRLRDTTETEWVDVVAHSMGGLAVRHLLLHLDRRGVRRVVFLATPHRGTYSAYLARGRGGIEMRPGSAFLQSVDASLPIPALAVGTPLDTYVLPPTSAVSPHAINERVWCGHRWMVRHRRAFEYTRRFLAS